jgi:hypothetical protein
MTALLVAWLTITRGLALDGRGAADARPFPPGPAPLAGPPSSRKGDRRKDY